MTDPTRPADDPRADANAAPAKPNDADTVARALSEEAPLPGGGGLGDRDAVSETSATGTARNAPIDVPVPGERGLAEDRGQREAQHRAGDADPPEPHPTSQ